VVNVIRYLDYACTPNNITIEARYPATSRYLEVELKVDGKIALHGQYTISLPTKRDIIDERIKTFCGGIGMFTEDEIQDYVMADRIMAALYTKRHLKEVRTKSGTLIWRF